MSDKDSNVSVILDNYLTAPFFIKPDELSKDSNIYTSGIPKVSCFDYASTDRDPSEIFAEELHFNFKEVITPLGRFSINIEPNVKDGESHLLGSMDMDTRTIHLSSDHSCSGSQKETFIHELMHLALELGGYLEDKDGEEVESTVEKTTTQASRGLTYLMNMNKDLFIFLARWDSYE